MPAKLIEVGSGVKRQTVNKHSILIIMFPWYTRKKKAKKSKDSQPYTTSKEKKKRPVNLTKKLDRVFSAYIRLRDVMPNGCFRCISCGQIKRFEDGDCGHYRSRIHMATRWEPDNAHMECRGRNRASADHLIDYRRNLIGKIGLNRIDRIEVLSKSQKHWLDFELQEKIDYFTQEVKRLSAEKGINVKI